MNRWKHWIASLRGAANAGGGGSKESENRYLAIYRGNPPWLSSCGGHTLHLGRTVARELARTLCCEMEVQIHGSARGEYLKMQIDRLLSSFASDLGGVLGVGEGIFLASCAARGGVQVEFLLPDRYEVKERDAYGNIVQVCFLRPTETGGERYLLKEEHTLLGGGAYRIESRAFHLDQGQERPVPLTTVKAWKDRPAVLLMEGMAGGLFVEWRLSCKEGRAEGEAIYAAGLDLMQDADRQYERLLWEFEGGELAVDASEEAFRIDEHGEPMLPLGKDRLYRMNAIDAGSEKGEMMQVFSPALRDESLIRGLNRILMLFEDAIGVARGTVSDPNALARTATEIKMLRQRTYLTVSALKKETREILFEIAKAMERVIDLYALCPRGAWEMTVRFDDTLLIDSEGEREADRADAVAGLLDREEYRRKWHGTGGNV